MNTNGERGRTHGKREAEIYIGATLRWQTTSAMIAHFQCLFAPRGSFVLHAWPDSVDERGDRGEISGRSVVVQPDDTVEDVFRRVLKKLWGKPFLPRRAGVSGTWLAVCQNPVAVVADGWPEPKFIVAPSASAQTLFAAKSPASLHFHYLSSLDPDFVFKNATTEMFAKYV